MVLNSFTSLRLFSHKTGALNTSVRGLGRGNLAQLIQWVADWLLLPVDTAGHENSFLIGVVPDALIAQQLKKALPHLSIITGDEAPKERKRIFKQLDGDKPKRMIITLREALPWLHQNPLKTSLMWAWGYGVYQRLPHQGASVLLYNHCIASTPLKQIQGVHYSRFWYWGTSISVETMRCLTLGNHRLLWVTLGITRLEQHRIEQEAKAICLNPAQLHIALHQQGIHYDGLDQAMAFLSRQNTQLLCCDSTVFSSLILPQTDDSGVPLHYHLVLESRVNKCTNHPQDVLNAYSWYSVRHYTQEWWRIKE